MAHKTPTLAQRAQANLRSLRKARKLSQEQLAAKCGLSVSYISMMEQAKRTPPLDTLEVLGKGLEVNPLRLLAEV